MAGALPAGVEPLAPVGGLLAVHAHPDDETLSTGALLATWAASGNPVTVVTCTRGERGEVIALPGTASEGLDHLEGDGPALAAHRVGELADAMAALGVTDHVFLDETGAVPRGSVRYEDSGMRWVGPGIAAAARDSGPAAFARIPLDEAAGRLAALIGDRRPSVVVTYGPGGGYGHPDHVRAHQVAVRALELLGDGPRPRLWCHAVPEGTLRDQWRALARASAAGRLPAPVRDLGIPDPDQAVLPPVAVDPETLRGAVAVDVAPVLPRLLAALRAHATQVRGAIPWREGAGEGPVVGCYALSNDVLAPIASHEFYVKSAELAGYLGTVASPARVP